MRARNLSMKNYVHVVTVMFYSKKTLVQFISRLVYARNYLWYSGVYIADIIAIEQYRVSRVSGKAESS